MRRSVRHSRQSLSLPVGWWPGLSSGEFGARRNTFHRMPFMKKRACGKCSLCILKIVTITLIRRLHEKKYSGDPPEYSRHRSLCRPCVGGGNEPACGCHCQAAGNGAAIHRHAGGPWLSWYSRWAADQHAAGLRLGPLGRLDLLHGRGFWWRHGWCGAYERAWTGCLRQILWTDAPQQVHH